MKSANTPRISFSGFVVLAAKLFNEKGLTEA